MKVRLEHCVLFRADPAPSFVAVRALDVTGATVECKGERRRLSECRSCPHFLDAPDCALRCVFLDNDTVESVMTPSSRLVTASVDEARRGVRRQAPRQLLVTDGDDVVALVKADGRARHRLEPVPIVPRTAALGVVAAMLAAHPALVVVDRDAVVGIVTRGDLQRAGVPILAASD